ncbi:MAG: hypothetical protein INR69_17530 [Mucilaginibacter polytrichastri]|nr:hypothetical protein [Mucilaginibacter polytrichastri]
MKNIYLTLSLCLLISLTGCKKDSPEAREAKTTFREKLIGKWTFTRLSRTRYFAGNQESETGDLKLNEGDYIEFREDGSITFVTFSKTLNGTFNILSENEFALKTSIGTSRSTVVTLTTKELVFTDQIVDDGQTMSASTYYATK